MLIFFGEKGKKFFKKSLEATEFYEKIGQKQSQ
jgi:hypothetical protein